MNDASYELFTCFIVQFLSYVPNLIAITFPLEVVQRFDFLPMNGGDAHCTLAAHETISSFTLSKRNYFGGRGAYYSDVPCDRNAVHDQRERKLSGSGVPFLSFSATVVEN